MDRNEAHPSVIKSTSSLICSRRSRDSIRREGKHLSTARSSTLERVPPLSKLVFLTQPRLSKPRSLEGSIPVVLILHRLRACHLTARHNPWVWACSRWVPNPWAREVVRDLDHLTTRASDPTLRHRSSVQLVLDRAHKRPIHLMEPLMLSLKARAEVCLWAQDPKEEVEWECSRWVVTLSRRQLNRLLTSQV